jgi:hypothetical protein
VKFLYNWRRNIVLNSIKYRGAIFKGIVRPTKYVHIKSTTVYAPRRNWESPPSPPHPQASVPPPPCFWGEGNTRWRERGWESPNSDEGRTLWYSLYVRTLWSGHSNWGARLESLHPLLNSRCPASLNFFFFF